MSGDKEPPRKVNETFSVGHGASHRRRLHHRRRPLPSSSRNKAARAEVIEQTPVKDYRGEGGRHSKGGAAGCQHWSNDAGAARTRRSRQRGLNLATARQAGARDGGGGGGAAAPAASVGTRACCNRRSIRGLRANEKTRVTPCCAPGRQGVARTVRAGSVACSCRRRRATVRSTAPSATRCWAGLRCTRAAAEGHADADDHPPHGPEPGVSARGETSDCE